MSREKSKKVTSLKSGRVGAVLERKRLAEGIETHGEFCRTYGLNLDVYRTWIHKGREPKIEEHIAIMKALGYDAMEELGFDLGGLMDALRGDMSEKRREAHHWIEEIFRHAPEEFQKTVLLQLREKGGKYGRKPFVVK